MADILITNLTSTAEGDLVGPIVPKLGYGGHPIGARPKKKALTVWEGRQPFQMEIPLILHRGGGSVESDRRALDEMATVEDNTKIKDQKSVFCKPGPGIVLPVPPSLGPSPLWWIEDLSWGDELRNNPAAPSDPGELTRKLVTVTLLERVDDTLLGQETGIPRVRTNKAHLYTVRKGDTLHSIAASQLGNATRWEEIKKLNPKIRSDGDLKPGLVIKIPPTTAAGWAQPTTRG